MDQKRGVLLWGRSEENPKHNAFPLFSFGFVSLNMKEYLRTSIGFVLT